MNDELEKMKLHSPDWANENIRKLAEIFPNCVTETQDADGKVKMFTQAPAGFDNESAVNLWLADGTPVFMTPRYLHYVRND